jgi:CelD/BcsL family acetyltransferase involved in cellulose biosynthesis
MAITIHIRWDLPADGWTEALAQCPGATWFHSAAWLEVARQAFGTQIERVRVGFADGRWALLPLSIRPLACGLVPMAIAGETGAYSGLVSPEPLSDAEVCAVYDAVRARHGAVKVVGNPFAIAPHLPTAEGWTTGVDTTHLLVLRPLSELRKGFSRGCKARGNKARKLGLEVVTSSDPAIVEVFYPLYLDSAVRWGEKLTWARSKDYFRAMLEQGGDDVTVFVAKREGDPIAALLFAAQGQVAHYVAGATRHDQLDACPSNLLQEAAMEHYFKAGFTFYDFGPSNRLEGVQRFKESFGATSAPFGSIERLNAAGRAYFALRNAYTKLRERGAPAPDPATADAA